MEPARTSDERSKRLPADLEHALLEVARSTATHTLGTLLCDLAALLQEFIACDRLTLVLHDPAHETMRLHSVAAFHRTLMTVTELPILDSPSGVAWQTQEPVVVPSIERETRFARATPFLLAEGMRSLCAVPLTSPLRRLGALSFASRKEDAFSGADVELLRQLSPHVALAVDNALHQQDAEQAQHELARERDRLRLLLEVNNTLVSNLELRPLFSAVTGVLRRIVPHEYTSLALYDAERNAFEVRALEFDGRGPAAEHSFVPADGTPAGAAFAAGKTMRFERADLERLPSEFAARLLAEGIESACCIPLTVHDDRLGTLNVARRGGEAFTADDEDLLGAVANQVAFAVENSLAFQRIAELKDKLAAQNVYLQEEIRTQHDFEEIIGDSSALRSVLQELETVAPTDSTVLVVGETGTGKELIARAIHDLSARRSGTFVKINCAAIPTGLLESELFGHERGAFTGAIAQRVGRFEFANGGTLFLDEVGDIPLELQPKLLRVLQEQEFERLGSSRTIRVDVRLVAATHRDLAEMVDQGSFRRDLYYRLNVFPLALPPLRERSEDIPALVRYYVQKFARRLSRPIDTIPADAMTALTRYAWPGNVRELENAIERAVILTRGNVLRVPVAEFRRHTAKAPAAGTLEKTEREAILRALQDARWVVGGPEGAAARLGLKRTTLQSRMQKLGIDRARA